MLDNHLKSEIEIVEKPCLARIHTDFLRIYTDSFDDKSVFIRYQFVYIRVKRRFFNGLKFGTGKVTYQYKK